jgi:hypothetical protein
MNEDDLPHESPGLHGMKIAVSPARPWSEDLTISILDRDETLTPTIDIRPKDAIAFGEELIRRAQAVQDQIEYNRQLEQNLKINEA